MANKIIQIYKHLTEFLSEFSSYNPYIGTPKIQEGKLWGYK